MLFIVLFTLFLAAIGAFGFKKLNSKPLKCEENTALPKVGKHAIVCGGSIAGLMYARCLSTHFEKVTVVEADSLDNTRKQTARSGVPQGGHVHVLGMTGARLLAKFFPDFYALAYKNGARAHEWGCSMQWFSHGGWLPVHSGLRNKALLFASRVNLESVVLELVSALPNVEIREETRVKSFLISDNVLKGVAVRSRGVDAHDEELYADFVVDAMGRRSRAVNMLAEHGFHPPPTDETITGVGYTTMLVRRRKNPEMEWNFQGAFVWPSKKEDKHMGSILLADNDTFFCTVGCWAHAYVGATEEEILECTKTLERPILFDLLTKHLERVPGTPITTYRYKGSLWKHWEKARLPDNFVSLGDAMASFNPVLGQGMTMAAKGCGALDKAFWEKRNGAEYTPSQFRSRVYEIFAPQLQSAWDMAGFEDFKYEESIGVRPPMLGFLLGYFWYLWAAVRSSKKLYTIFTDVLSGDAEPTVLFSPTFLWPISLLALGLKKQESRFFDRDPPVLPEPPPAFGPNEQPFPPPTK